MGAAGRGRNATGVVSSLTFLFPAAGSLLALPIQSAEIVLIFVSILQSKQVNIKRLRNIKAVTAVTSFLIFDLFKLTGQHSRNL